MARKLVRLQYQFEFDPSRLWSKKSEFDKALADFFAAHQIETEFIDFIGEPTLSLLYLDKMELVAPIKPKEDKRTMDKIMSGLRPLKTKK